MTGAGGAGEAPVAAGEGPVGAGAAPDSSTTNDVGLVGVGGTSATVEPGSLCYIGSGGGLPDCESESGSTDAGWHMVSGVEPPDGTHWHIEGSLDGELLHFEDDNTAAYLTSGLLRYNVGGAHLWVTGNEAALRLPFSHGAEFICFSADTDRAAPAMTFTSGQLSRLDCGCEEQAPLHLRFGRGVPAIMLNHLGETAELYNDSGFCNADGCELQFGDRENGIWVLWLDAWVAPGRSAEFTQSALAHYGDSFSGARGGGGTITVSNTPAEVEEGHYVVEVAIDSMGPLQTCPAVPVEGALQGWLPYP